MADGDVTLVGQGEDRISVEEFDALRTLIHRHTGVMLGDAKRNMLCSRLARRLRHLGMTRYGEYYRYVREQGPDGEEMQELINCITTNKTDFFREAHHFDFLKGTIIPALQARARQSGPKRLHVWSAGCSTGEEPYTLAMTLREAFGTAAGWDLRIVATDIDTEVLSKAQRGVYEEERIDALPEGIKKAYFLRGTGANAGMVAVRPAVRDLVQFRQVNLIDERWPIQERFDLILCRNVMIYFTRETQTRLLHRFADHLQPGGYLFLGHSENMQGMAETFQPLGGTIFQRVGAAESPVRPSERLPPQARPAPAPRPEDRTLIVGDVVACESPAVLKTLLGSCVSACIFDPRAGVGGMNHFSLPGGSTDERACTRYGVHAMELLINEIMKRGGDRRRLRAKVFGGAKVLNVNSEALNIGHRNGRFVLEFLDSEGIEVAARCLGGECGLRVQFYPHTGKALVKPLDGCLLVDVARDEVRYSQDVQRSLSQPSECDVTLF